MKADLFAINIICNKYADSHAHQCTLCLKVFLSLVWCYSHHKYDSNCFNCGSAHLLQAAGVYSGWWEVSTANPLPVNSCWPFILFQMWVELEWIHCRGPGGFKEFKLKAYRRSRGWKCLLEIGLWPPVSPVPLTINWTAAFCSDISIGNASHFGFHDNLSDFSRWQG